MTAPSEKGYNENRGTIRDMDLRSSGAQVGMVEFLVVWYGGIGVGVVKT